MSEETLHTIKIWTLWSIEQYTINPIYTYSKMKYYEWIVVKLIIVLFISHNTTAMEFVTNLRDDKYFRLSLSFLLYILNFHVVLSL